jgi:glucosamine-6-phosphate deaminase
MLKVTVFKDERTLARTLAAHVAATLDATPDLVLGLPTGRTPVRTYHELGALHARGRVDFSRATTFNLDEFLGIEPSHPGSYRTFMQEHLFSRVNMAPERINVLNGAAPDPEGECARYEQAIADAGGIGLQLLGIGTNGHIGFNEPAKELAAKCIERVIKGPITTKLPASFLQLHPTVEIMLDEAAAGL